MSYKYKLKYEFTEYPRCTIDIQSNEEWETFDKAYVELQKEIKSIILKNSIKIKFAVVEKVENDNIIGFK